MPRITICTATYNMENYIHRVYESLKDQSYKNFEWIVVDDCSTDETENLVKTWIDEKPFFPIIYLKQPENKGKMTAVNRGSRHARGEFFMNLDGDDSLKPHALQRYMEEWDKIDPSLRDKIGVLITHGEDQNGNFVGSHFPIDPLICTYYEKKFKYRIKEDKSQLFRTQAVLEFPLYEEDRHVIHSATYFDMSSKYKCYCFEDIVWIYYREEKITLSTRTKKLRFIKGRQFYAERRINKYLHEIPSDSKKLYVWKFWFLTYLSYTRYSHHLGLSFTEMLRRIRKGSDKLFFIAVFPVGYFLCISDKLKGRI